MRDYIIETYRKPKGDNKFKKISLEQFKECGWYYCDGSQPITNGDWGIVVDGDKITHIISCCSNCGDYNVMDEQDMAGDSDEMERLMKTLFLRMSQDL